MHRSVLVAAALVLSGCATASTAEGEMSERAAKRLAEFDRTGDITSCLSVARIKSITPLDDYHFLVRVGVSDYYLNEVSRCSGAARSGNRIQYQLSGSQLCRNQIVSIVDNTSGFTVGSCGLGGFERLTKKPAE